MENEEHKKQDKLNIMWWVLLILLITLGIAASYYFNEIPRALCFAGWILLTCVVTIIAAQTVQGKKIWAFAKEARIEMRKVIWPTRQETVQTTIVIAAIVVVMALILWGVDSVLLWLIGWLTGQRG
jgi:preprotein translocase subunit SecE